MKTTCSIRTNLLSISRNTSTDSNSKTSYPCSGKCSTCCCAVLMLRFIAYCDDPVALAADARALLEKCKSQSLHYNYSPAITGRVDNILSVAHSAD